MTKETLRNYDGCFVLKVLKDESGTKTKPKLLFSMVNSHISFLIYTILNSLLNQKTFFQPDEEKDLYFWVGTHHLQEQEIYCANSDIDMCLEVNFRIQGLISLDPEEVKAYLRSIENSWWIIEFPQNWMVNVVPVPDLRRLSVYNEVMWKKGCILDSDGFNNTLENLEDSFYSQNEDIGDVPYTTDWNEPWRENFEDFEAKSFEFDPFDGV